MVKARPASAFLRAYVTQQQRAHDPRLARNADPVCAGIVTGCGELVSWRGAWTSVAPLRFGSEASRCVGAPLATVAAARRRCAARSLTQCQTLHRTVSRIRRPHAQALLSGAAIYAGSAMSRDRRRQQSGRPRGIRRLLGPIASDPSSVPLPASRRRSTGPGERIALSITGCRSRFPTRTVPGKKCSRPPRTEPGRLPQPLLWRIHNGDCYGSHP